MRVSNEFHEFRMDWRYSVYSTIKKAFEALISRRFNNRSLKKTGIYVLRDIFKGNFENFVTDLTKFNSDFNL